MSDVEIRRATEADVPDMNSIYNGYIVDSHVSFDLEAWSVEKRLDWFRSRVADGHPVLVACDRDEVIGVSWAGPWQPKRAYRSSVETTVVLAQESVGRGVGTQLYAALLDALRSEGFHRAYAIIALPNDRSIVLHRNLGYREIGVLDQAGFKNGKYHSTMLMELALD